MADAIVYCPWDAKRNLYDGMEWLCLNATVNANGNVYADLSIDISDSDVDVNDSKFMLYHCVAVSIDKYTIIWIND